MGGLAFTETLTGTLRLTRDPARERPIALSYRALTGPLRAFLRRPELVIEGAIDADGLAAHGHLRGTLALVASPERALALDQAFTFTADDGALTAFHGRRALRLGALGLLSGAFTDARGQVVARALLRFDLRTELARLLRSLRLHPS
jgi:hypothetical protein